MELKSLRYFLAIANAGSISKAARELGVSQPTLSRQLSLLEQEFGHELYSRTHEGIELTEYGITLKGNAETLVALADKTEREMTLPANSVAGVVDIGAGDTQAVHLLARAIKRVRAQYPGVSFRFFSGTGTQLLEGLERGQYDLILNCEPKAYSHMNELPLPMSDTWCAVMRNDDPLAEKQSIEPADLKDCDLILPQNSTNLLTLGSWLNAGKLADNAVAHFSLPLNLRYLVEAGIGIGITYDNLITRSEGAVLCSRPLAPKIVSRHSVFWRKAMPSKQAAVFLRALQQVCAE